MNFLTLETTQSLTSVFHAKKINFMCDVMKER